VWKALLVDEVVFMGRKSVCIVGGGLAGLSTAYHLLIKGVKDITLIELSDRVGGLLKSEVISGYTFDVGGSHILFSKNLRTLNEMLNLLKWDVVKHYRNAKIFYKGTFVKYPFENGLGDLPPEERFECVWDLINTYVKRVKGELPQPKNFREWIVYVFGNAIASKYLIPYNEKIWKVDLSEVSLEWVEGRVPNPPLEDVVKSAVGLSVEGYTHQLNFYYPSSGGIESLAKALSKEIVNEGVEVLLNKPVELIRKSINGKLLVEAEGVEKVCDAVVYTAPLNRSAEVLSELLNDLSNSLKALRSVPLAVVGLAVRGEALPYHWVYFPNSKELFHRVAILSNFSRSNAPEGSVALIAEVSFRSLDEMNAVSDDELIHKVYQDLEGSGLVRNPKLEFGVVRRWADAYIIYDTIRSSVLKEVVNKLRTYGVYPHGRFGSWEYLNMDAVYEKSAKLADEVITYLTRAS